MKIANNLTNFINNVVNAEAKMLNSPEGHKLTQELLDKKLAQNPSMTAEEWNKAKQQFIVFVFSELMRENPEMMKELCGHVWTELQKG